MQLKWILAFNVHSVLALAVACTIMRAAMLLLAVATTSRQQMPKEICQTSTSMPN